MMGLVFISEIIIVIISLVICLSDQQPADFKTFTACPPGGPVELIPEGPNTNGIVIINTTDAIELLSPCDISYFGINQTQPYNVLFINKSLDAETTQHLSCKYNCGGSPLQLSISILDVDEYPADFNNAPYSISITQDTEVGTSVFTVGYLVQDRDVTKTPITIYFSDDSGTFTMVNAVEGVITLNKSLSYAQGPREYKLNISAEDPGGLTSSTTLTVHINDTDRYGPVFSHFTYNLSIPEGDHFNRVYTTDPPISAEDGDSLNATVNFVIDTSTIPSLAYRIAVLDNGSLIVNGSWIIGLYFLNIRAFQVDRPIDRFAIASVLLEVYDINDHYPVMAENLYFANVSEDAVTGTIIQIVSATDQDIGINSIFRFYIGASTDIFNITTDGSVGYIILTGLLDHEKVDQYTLNVYAEENLSLDHHRSNESTVHITVLDINDNSPVFANQSYTFFVNQTAMIGTVIGQINASDADKGDNGRVSFSILNGEEGTYNVFNIDETFGWITLSRNLSRNDVGICFIFVKVQDNAADVRQRRSNVTLVEVHIQSVDLYPPRFTQNNYSFIVSETALIGTYIGSIKAIDEDGDELNMTMAQDPAQAFTLQQTVYGASLYVNSSLDLDFQNAEHEHVLQVMASDGSFTSSANVTVTVTYVNEFSPVMETIYKADILENDTMQTPVVQINASDQDKGKDGMIKYFLTQNDGDPFVINQTTGLIILNCSGCLDYNNKSQYLFEVTAKDGGVPQKSAAAVVLVNIKNINNKGPKFTATIFFGSLSENAAAGQTVLQLYAVDEDTPAVNLMFSINSSYPPALNLTESYLITNTMLDAEKNKFITGSVKVSDGVNVDYAFFNITVMDVNDNPPQVILKPNPVVLLENVTVGTLVINVSASDVDITPSKFLYWLDNSFGKFSINYQTGEITVLGIFDRRLRTNYDLKVFVSDEAFVSSDILLVNLSDSNTAPYFVNEHNITTHVYNFSVKEDVPVGYRVGKIQAEDKDSGSSGQVHLSITSGNVGNHFQLEPYSRELIVTHKLDYENASFYELTIEAVDNSFVPKTATATLSISIVNVPEAPLWPYQMPLLHLTTMTGQKCDNVHLVAYPQDILTVISKSRLATAVIYSLLNYTDVFYINETTGVFKVKGALSPKTYSVGLRACSNQYRNVCSDTLLTVAVDNNAAIIFCPSFLTIHVNESVNVGYTVVDLNVTDGNQDTLYSLQDPSMTAFNISSGTGVLQVAKQLDRETKGLYIILVSALNIPDNTTATAQVTVIVDDAPDSKPVFKSSLYKGKIFENSPVGSPVLTVGMEQPLQVEATDPDLNPVLIYSILKDDSNNTFKLNSTSGEITVAVPIDLEMMSAALHARYSLDIMVSDGYFDDTCSVVIEVLNKNDNDPVFQPPVVNLSLPENTQIGSFRVQLNVSDLDAEDAGKLTFLIQYGEDEDSFPFEVDGKGFLKLSNQLDREKQDRYTFIVTATDPGGRNGSEVINILVEDVNDESPVFEYKEYTFNVTEEAESLGKSLLVSAHDNDTGINAALFYSIHSGNGQNAFNISTINSSLAIIEVVKRLDREAVSTFQLVVTATDGGHPPNTGTCDVLVTVQDINDNAPTFNSNFSTRISEAASNNTVLTLTPSMSVTDPDLGRFGQEGIVFHLKIDNTSPVLPFRVDTHTGNIYIYFSNSDDHLNQGFLAPSYILQLVAIDDDGNGLNASAIVQVTVTSLNQSTPHFTQQVYNWVVPEDAEPGFLIGTVSATDGDSNPMQLRYYLPNETFGFYLNPISGELKLATRLDREKQSQYSFSLQVSDGLFSSQAMAFVVVLDANDNCPTYSDPNHQERPLLLTVGENSPGNVIYNFSAWTHDADVGSNGSVIFFMNDSSIIQYINISNDGQLSILQVLDFDSKNQSILRFTVWAADLGTPPCSVPLQVIVEVSSVNEYQPQVCILIPEHPLQCVQNFTISVYDQSPADTFLAVLVSQDMDQGEAGQVMLSISNDKAGLLSFSETAGVMTLARKLVAADLILQNWLEADNATYIANIIAEDHGIPSKNSSFVLALNISPVIISNRLEFVRSLYSFTVMENQNHTFVGNVSVKNSTLGLNYTMSCGEFSINSEGVITTVAFLDREYRSSYTCIILAFDSTAAYQTATAVVLLYVVDENDNAPIFAQTVYNVIVPENEIVAVLLKIVATDADAGENAHVTYKLLNTSLVDVFVIDKVTGVMSLNTSLDHEKQSSYTLVVEADDNGSLPLSSTAIVTVTVTDINDNTPVFVNLPYIAYLSAKALASTKIISVHAADSDEGSNGVVVYEIDHLKDSSVFFIDEITGTIYLSRDLDYDKEHVLNLTIRASDLGQPSLTSLAVVTIYISDLSAVPHFIISPKRVGLVLGTLRDTILPVNVSGINTGVNYVFNISGNDADHFAIDHSSGLIYVAKNLTTSSEYSLTIQAINRDVPQYAVTDKLTILVIDVKLSQESYTAIIPENSPAPPPILLIDITSNAEFYHLPVIYTLTSETDIKGIFYIVESDGTLFCNASLDREKQDVYKLQVSVQLANASIPGRKKRDASNVADILIMVSDKNDNSPQFDLAFATFGISSTAQALTVVTQLKAFDPDEGLAGEVVYTVTGGDNDVFFVTSDGQVTSKKAMREVQKNLFDLTVSATDVKGAGLSSSLAIKVVKVTENNGFGLVANLPVTAFIDKQDFYLRNLSDILNFTLHLVKVESHVSTVVDTTKSDIYFYAFDKNNQPMTYSEVQKKVEEKIDAINALFNSTDSSIKLIQVTVPPIQLRVNTKYQLGEAEIALFVVAGLIFINSAIAILIVFRAWAKQKALQAQVEAAAKARKRLEEETQELADKKQESTFIVDPEEPLELHGKHKVLETEDQECVIDLGNEVTGVDTVKLHGMVFQLSGVTKLDTETEEVQSHDFAADSGIEQRSPSTSSSISHQQETQIQANISRSDMDSQHDVYAVVNKTKKQADKSGHSKSAEEVHEDTFSDHLDSKHEDIVVDHRAVSDSPVDQHKYVKDGIITKQPPSTGINETTKAAVDMNGSNMTECQPNELDITEYSTGHGYESIKEINQWMENGSLFTCKENEITLMSDETKVHTQVEKDEKTDMTKDALKENPVFQYKGIHNGWAEDYDMYGLPTHEMITEL